MGWGGDNSWGGEAKSDWGNKSQDKWGGEKKDKWGGGGGGNDWGAKKEDKWGGGGNDKWGGEKKDNWGGNDSGGNDWGKKDDWGGKKDDWGGKKDDWGGKKDSWGESGKADAWGDDGGAKKPNYDDFEHRHTMERWEREEDVPETNVIVDEATGEETDKLDLVKMADSEEIFVVGGAKKLDELGRWATWADCEDGMPASLVEIMTNVGFEKPTTIQQYAWPAIMAKDDLIGVAKTGSGKTLAFLVPSFISAKLAELKQEPQGWPRLDYAHPHVLVIAPTRELCNQIYEEAVKFGEPAGLRSCAVYGGEGNSQTQKTNLSYNNPHLIAATPGRLMDFLDKGLVKLDDCQFVILDEADRMLDMGFELDIRSIVESAPDGRQSLLFSATFPPAVKALAAKFCYRDAVHIQIGSSDPLTGNKDIEQKVEFYADDRQKDDALYEMVGANWDTENKCWKEGNYKYVVFCNSKRKCAELSQKFSDWGIEAVALYGDLTQSTRDWNLQQFKQGLAKCLFATDVASRGLDIPDVTAVINYDPSDCKETHVHRIGRTGRAGHKGLAITYITDYEKVYLRFIVETMKRCGQEVDDELVTLAKENSGWGKKW